MKGGNARVPIYTGTPSVTIATNENVNIAQRFKLDERHMDYITANI